MNDLEKEEIDIEALNKLIYAAKDVLGIIRLFLIFIIVISVLGFTIGLWGL